MQTPGSPRRDSQDVGFPGDTSNKLAMTRGSVSSGKERLRLAVNTETEPLQPLTLPACSLARAGWQCSLALFLPGGETEFPQTFPTAGGEVRNHTVVCKPSTAHWP